MADNYFGARKRLDDLIDIFQSFAAACREKGRAVEAAAQFLNALLTSRAEATRFYKVIGIDDPEALLIPGAVNAGILDVLPNAFTQKGRYVQTVRRAYDVLQKQCEDYLHGPPDYQPEQEGAEYKEAHYDLMVNMAAAINQQIKKVNQNRSAGATLQYVRGFQPDWEQKATIAGASLTGFAEGVDQKLAYQPIRFEDFGLVLYPDLPTLRSVEKSIKKVCNDVYRRRSAMVKAVMSELAAGKTRQNAS